MVEGGERGQFNWMSLGHHTEGACHEKKRDIGKLKTIRKIGCLEPCDGRQEARIGFTGDPLDPRRDKVEVQEVGKWVSPIPIRLFGTLLGSKWRGLRVQ